MALVVPPASMLRALLGMTCSSVSAWPFLYLLCCLVLFCFALKKLFEACSAFYPGLVIGLSEGKKTRRGKGSQRKVGKETTHHVGV